MYKLTKSSQLFDLHLSRVKWNELVLLEYVEQINKLFGRTVCCCVLNQTL